MSGIAEVRHAFRPRGMSVRRMSKGVLGRTRRIKQWNRTCARYSRSCKHEDGITKVNICPICDRMWNGNELIVPNQGGRFKVSQFICDQCKLEQGELDAIERPASQAQVEADEGREDIYECEHCNAEFGESEIDAISKQVELPSAHDAKKRRN